MLTMIRFYIAKGLCKLGNVLSNAALAILPTPAEVKAVTAKQEAAKRVPRQTLEYALCFWALLVAIAMFAVGTGLAKALGFAGIPVAFLVGSGLAKLQAYLWKRAHS